MKGFSDLLKAYTTYSDLFGFGYKKEKLIQLIKDAPAKMCLCAISQLLAFPDQADATIVRKGFVEYLKLMMKGKPYDGLIDFEKKLEDRVLYTPQGLMASAKWLLAYGNFTQEEKAEPESVVFGVIYMCLIVSEYLGQIPKDDLPYDMIRNANFNAQADIGAEIVRTLYVFTELAAEKSLYENDFLDINKDFENFFGYSIVQYVSVVFALYAYFGNDKRMINTNCFVEIFDIFKNTALNDIAYKILPEMMVTPEEAKRNALQCIDSDWDYKMFWEKPFLTVDGKTAVPIAYRTLFANSFTALKIKIEKCYSGKMGDRFRRFFGQVFEKYVFKLLERSVNGKDALTLKGEFNYAGKKSPDALLLFGKRKLFAIEAKGKYMRKPSVFHSDSGSILSEIERLIVEPIYQLNDRLDELISSPKKQIDLTAVKSIYLFSVSVSGIPTNPHIQREINIALKEKITLSQIKGLYWLGIEEFEMLCAVVEHPPKGRSVFKILDRISNNGHSFHNYILISYKVKKPKLLADLHEEMFNKIKLASFPK